MATEDVKKVAWLVKHRPILWMGKMALLISLVWLRGTVWEPAVWSTFGVMVGVHMMLPREGVD